MTVEKFIKLSLKEVMDKNFDKVTSDTTIAKAISIMQKNNQYEIPVVGKNNKLNGLFSYHSLIKIGRVTMNEKVEHLQINIPILKINDTVLRGAEFLISSDFRLLPVTENNKVEGVIRREKIIELASDIKTWEEINVTEIMSTPVEVVNENDRLRKARTLLRRLDIRTIPVINENGKLTGVVGTKDIITYLKPKKRAQQGTVYGERTHFNPDVKAVMIDNPQFLTEDATVSQVINIMQDKNISTVVIVKDNKPVGIVSGYDILEYIVSARKKQKGVFINISGLEEEEPYVLETLFEIIEGSMKRINNIFHAKVLNIHVRTYNIEGHEIKYSVHMRLTTDKHLFTTKSANWNLFSAFSEGADRLFTQVVKKKEMMKNHKFK